MWYIIFPGSDLTSIKVIEISNQYEVKDYTLASRQVFISRKEAVSYAKNLAKEHGVQFIPTSQEDFYLD